MARCRPRLAPSSPTTAEVSVSASTAGIPPLGELLRSRGRAHSHWAAPDACGRPMSFESPRRLSSERHRRCCDEQSFRDRQAHSGPETYEWSRCSHQTPHVRSRSARRAEGPRSSAGRQASGSSAPLRETLRSGWSLGSPGLVLEGKATSDDRLATADALARLMHKAVPGDVTTRYTADT